MLWLVLLLTTGNAQNVAFPKLCPSQNSPFEFVSNTEFSCVFIRNDTVPTSCDSLCSSFGARCAYAKNMQMQLDTNCSDLQPWLQCSCLGPILSIANGGLCPDSFPSLKPLDRANVVMSAPRHCVLNFSTSGNSRSCNDFCQPMGAFTWGVWDASDPFTLGGATSPESKYRNQVCDCRKSDPPLPSGLGWFESLNGLYSACRAHPNDTVSTLGCGTADGCYYYLYYGTNELSVCEAMCLNDTSCLGIEFRAIGTRCELWYVPFWGPQTVNQDYECFARRLTTRPPASCPLPSVPDPFIPFSWRFPATPNCSDPLPSGDKCSLWCGTGLLPTEKLEIACNNGSWSPFPPKDSCVPIPKGTLDDRVTVSFSLDFNVSGACGGFLDLNSVEARTAIANAVADNVAASLNMTVSPTVIGTVANPPEGINISLMFRSIPNGPTGADYVADFFTLMDTGKSGLSQFNVSTINGICSIDTQIHSITLVFASLFAYLGGLPFWVVLAGIGVLFIAIICFLWINRRSEHPLALLGGFISLLNLGGKCVFIYFLWTAESQLLSKGLDATFFTLAFWICVGTLGLMFAFNLVTTVILFRIHALKNYDAFAVWVAKHKCGVFMVLLLCGLNPASFLILCSSSFDLDVFKAPLSHQAQGRFQLAGLIAVLLGDPGPLTLHVLTLLLVRESKTLGWDGGENSILFPLIFSAASLLVGILRRFCAVCYAPQKKGQKEDVEVEMIPEPEVIPISEPEPEPEDPRTIPYLSPMKQAEEIEQTGKAPVLDNYDEGASWQNDNASWKTTDDEASSSRSREGETEWRTRREAEEESVAWRTQEGQGRQDRNYAEMDR